MPEIQHQLKVLSGQIVQLASRFTDSEWQRAKKSGEMGGKLKSGTLACLPCTQSRELRRGGQLLLLQAVQLTRSNNRAKQRATLCKQGRVEGLMFGRIRLAADCWTDSTEAATLTGRRTLLAVERVMFPSALVLRRIKFTLMMMLWVSPISEQ